MGNWRTVSITGTMTAGDAAKLRDFLSYSYDTPDGFDNFGPLSFNPIRPGLCGLGAWPADQVSACGNLAERDYSVEDVAGELRKLVSLAPSMLLQVHCGGDWESDECVATVLVGEGLVRTVKPQQAKVAAPGEAQMMGNFLASLTRR